MMSIIRHALILSIWVGLATGVSAQTFTNVNVASGISVPSVTYSFRGAAWADFNGDGFIDLFAPGGDNNPVVLWTNAGNGTFTSSVVAPAPVGGLRQIHACVAADYDNDGDQDVYMVEGNLTTVAGAGPMQGNKLFRNNGNGTFTEVGATAGVNFAGRCMCASWGDYDRDGFLDLYVGTYGTNQNPVPPFANHILYRNNRNGTFSDVTTTTGTASPANAFAVLFADYDHDLWPDLWCANDLGETGAGAPTQVLRNNRNGTFTNQAANINAAAAIDGMGITVADIENDGDWDFYLSNVQTGAVLLLHDQPNSNYLFQGGNHRAVATANGLNTAQVGWSCRFFDYNNDGRNDLFQMNSLGFNRLFRGQTTSPLFVIDLAPAIGTVTPPGFAGCTVDYDNDGQMDIYVSAGFSTGSVLARNPGFIGNWIKVRLQGVVSNRDAIGATVIVRTATTAQRRQLVSGEGFLVDGDKRLHFGLGAATTVNEIEIRWPTGSVQYLSNVGVNQILSVVEPTFTFFGSMDPGSSNVIAMNFPADASLSYFGALAVSAAGEIYLADRRAVRVFANDPVIGLSTTLGNPFLGLYAGAVPMNGSPAMFFTIPNIPSLTGLGAFFVAVTLSPLYPSGVKSILGPQPFTIQ